MSGKKLLVYLAVLLGVAGGYMLTEWRQARQEAQEHTAKQVFQVKVADLKALTLKSDQGEIQLQRAADQGAAAAEWRLSKPITGKVDELTINSVLNALAELKRQRRLEEVPADRLKDYGLDRPVFTVEFQAEGQDHQLRFGRNAPGDQNIYAQKDNEPNVLLIRRSDKETLDRSVTALRNKSIFAVPPDKVTEIRLIRNTDRLILKKADSGWTLENRPQIKLRTDRLEALRRQLTDAKALEFVAEKADDFKKYGLAPSPTLRLTLLSGSREETLLIGSKKGERYYAQISGADPIMEVDKAWVEKLPATAESLEDRRLWSGDENEVQKIVWGEPDQHFSAWRSGKGWEIQKGDQPAVAVAAMKMSLVFWKLKELEFTQVLPGTGAPKEKAALFTLKLLGGEEKPLFSLSEFPGEKDQATVAFSQGEKTGTAVVPAKSLTDFKEMLASLRAAGGGDKPPAAK